MLISDEYCRPQSDAAPYAQHMINSYDICPSISHLFALDIMIVDMKCSKPFVRFMSECKQIFSDIFFTFCPINFKFFSIISTFETNSEGKFQLDSTPDEEFSHNVAQSGQYLHYPLSDLNEIWHQGSSKTFQ